MIRALGLKTKVSGGLETDSLSISNSARSERMADAEALGLGDWEDELGSTGPLSEPAAGCGNSRIIVGVAS